MLKGLDMVMYQALIRLLGQADVLSALSHKHDFVDFSKSDRRFIVGAGRPATPDDEAGTLNDEDEDLKFQEAKERWKDGDRFSVYDSDGEEIDLDRYFEGYQFLKEKDTRAKTTSAYLRPPHAVVQTSDATEDEGDYLVPGHVKYQRANVLWLNGRPKTPSELSVSMITVSPILSQIQPRTMIDERYGSTGTKLIWELITRM